MQTANIGAVADGNTAKRFAMDQIFHEDSFGMHSMWNGYSKWYSFMQDKMADTPVHQDTVLPVDTPVHFNVTADSTKKEKEKEKEEQETWKPVASFLHEKHVRFTRPYGSQALQFMTDMPAVQINDIQDGCFLVIDFFNGGGGTTMFLNYIVSKYKYYNNFLIIRRIEKEIYATLNDDYVLLKANTYKELFQRIDPICITGIFVNHLLGHPHVFQTHLYEYKLRKGVKLTTITHDYHLFYMTTQPTYEQLMMMNSQQPVRQNTATDTDFYDEIITQHSANLPIMNLAEKPNVRIVPLPDYSARQHRVTKTNPAKTVGILGNINTIKGSAVLLQLVTAMPHVQFVVFGLFDCFDEPNVTICYYKNIDELNTLLTKYNPHVLLELSLWPETYSYTLTLALLTGLPMISLTKPIESAVTQRIHEESRRRHGDGSCCHWAENVEEIQQCIETIDVSIPIHYYTISPIIQYDMYWNQLFIRGFNQEKEKEKEEENIVHDRSLLPTKLQKYAIYFPQFHECVENNALFYKGYTDIINLQQLQTSSYIHETLSPHLEYFQMRNTTDYDIVQNEHILEGSFQLLQDTNLDGLACYYYWFSTNTLSKDHMIMREGINRLFTKANQYNNNKRIFFIWANENWTNNAAMGHTRNAEIGNDYSVEQIDLNFNNMLPYFQNDAYLKSNDCPVLMMYHSFLLDDTKLHLWKQRLQELSRQHGFQGIKLYINVMSPSSLPNAVTELNKFYINFNYKINTDFRYQVEKKTVLDYEKYIEFCKDIPENIVQTLVFDFDNNARLINPNRQQFSTRCIKNYHFLKIKYMNRLLQKYTTKQQEQQGQDQGEKILLINSLNEWGEKMAIEPSNEIGFYYSNLLKDYL